jgi:hypothetical protein
MWATLGVPSSSLREWCASLQGQAVRPRHKLVGAQEVFVLTPGEPNRRVLFGDFSQAHSVSALFVFLYVIEFTDVSVVAAKTKILRLTRSCSRFTSLAKKICYMFEDFSLLVFFFSDNSGRISSH